MKRGLIADLVLLMVALVWGTTFVVVQNAVQILPPHSFNGIRFLLASIALLVIILLVNKKSLTTLGKRGWISGGILGIFLFAGYAFQTVGLLYTSASKAGFITGLSVVLVPLMSVLILKLIPKWTTITGVILSAIGLYLLTMLKDTSFQYGDILVFFCAIFFALQIIFTGKYAPHYEAIALAWVQISTVAVLSLIFAFVFEDVNSIFDSSKLFATNVIVALLITSIFATALAFLAQTTFQKFTTPTRVAIIFAMEPVFAAVTSFVVLDERLGFSASIGGFLIFTGMIFAEIPPESLFSFFRINKKNKPKHIKEQHL